MKLQNILCLISTVLLALLIPKASQATCSQAWVELINQVPEISLANGVPAYMTLTPKWVILDNTGSSSLTPPNCGVWARTNVAGLSVVSNYGGPSTLIPPNTWAQINGALTFTPPTEMSEGYYTPGHAMTTAVSFDGTAPNDTEGVVEIASDEGTEGFPFPRTIGLINVHVAAKPPTTWLTVVATAAEVSGNRFTINNPNLNKKATIFPFVTHVYDAPGATPMFWNHPIGMAYDGSKWYVYNSDNATMPPGIAFNVRVERNATRVTNCGRFCTNYFLNINDPSANYNPYAVVMVSAAGGLALNPHPIAVQYNAPYWQIVNSDLAPFGAIGGATGASFFVKVIGAAEYSTVSSSPGCSGYMAHKGSNGAGVLAEQGCGDGGISTRLLQFYWQLGRPTLPIIVTARLTVPSIYHPSPISLDPKYLGVMYSSGPQPQWEVYHEDGSVIPYTAFNVWGKPQMMGW